ncbi:MAG: AAA family ATPase [Phycisphaerae bacterium]|nr:AAA family ATPase [Phycisphaerae bacterium]
MRRIAVINQKGGVGKTTTTVNLGAALARRGYRVLLIDLDPQGHLTLSLGLDLEASSPTTYDLLTRSVSLSQARRRVNDALWCVGSHIELAAAEPELMGVVGREMILRDAIEAEPDAYDYILMDCPPSLGLLTLNALAAAKEVFVPVQPHFLALQGMGNLLKTVSLLSQRINPELRVTGILLCMFESGTRLAGEVVEELESFLSQAGRASMPWANARLFDTRVRRNIKLAESPSYGQTIFDYAPTSHGAIDYECLAAEVAGNGSSRPATDAPDEHPASHPLREPRPDVLDDAPDRSAMEPRGSYAPAPAEPSPTRAHGAGIEPSPNLPPTPVSQDPFSDDDQDWPALQ